jgi:hypothetical protein
MLIKIGDFEFTSVWDGVYYKKLSRYPNISDWEKRTIIEFVDYEASHGRDCEIECENADTLVEVHHALQNRDSYRNTPRPALITECTACPVRKGCATPFVCHTTSIENAKKILACGSLLSAIKARKVAVEELMAERRNAAKDPADYFEYIMLSWGNCQAGDRLVMERKLGRFPDEQDLSMDFTPGVRFYFHYEDLVKHPGRVFDGVLPMKIKDEIVLNDWLYAMVIPAGVELDVPDCLKDRAIYVENDCRDIWDWSEKIYRVIEKRYL